MKKIKIIGPKDPKNKKAIMTTSISKGLGKQFSPFILGPVPLYSGAPVPFSKNVENAWQFSKVYAQHVGSNRLPTKDYFKWAAAGWNDGRAHRYPMGKGVHPEFSWWDGERLDYLTARRKIYIPAYARDVVKTKAYRLLKAGYDSGEEIILWDFDGYDYEKEGKRCRMF